MATTADLIIRTAVAEALDSSAVVRFAEVTAVSGRTVTVDLAGVEVPGVACIGSYTDPQVGDRAWLLLQGSTLVAVGSNTVEGSGPGAVSYTHAQPIASTTWTINHNLGWRPSVNVFDSGGTQVGGTVVHTSDNQLTVSFALGGGAYAVSGWAYLS